MPRKRVVANGLLQPLWALLGVSSPWLAPAQSIVTWTNLHPATSWYSYANGVGPGQQVGQIYVGSVYHAALWTGSRASLVDLHPSGASASAANGLSGSLQVGSAVINGSYHAALWSGAPGTFVDLNPASATSSEALGVSGSQQVGYIGYGSGRHAALWSGTSNSFVDLHPAGYSYSTAYATSGSNQVGSVQLYNSQTHAAFWSSTAESFVDLGPGWWSSTTVPWSEARAIGGTNKAGFYQLYAEYVSKAALWAGSEFISLHPPEASTSQVLATTETMQVGFATINGQQCLGYWHGSAESFYNLGPLSTGFGTGVPMRIRGVWIEGNTIHLAGDRDSQAIYCRIEPAPPPIPAAPMGLMATPVSACQIDLRWTDKATNENSFVVAQSINPGGPYREIATLPANSTSYSGTNYADSTSYYLVVRAVNNYGSASSGEVRAMTLSPVHVHRVDPLVGTATETFEELSRDGCPWSEIEVPIFSGGATISGPYDWIWLNGPLGGGGTLGWGSYTARSHDGNQGYANGYMYGTSRVTFVNPTWSFGGYWGSGSTTLPILFRFYDAKDMLIDMSSVLYSAPDRNGTLEWFGWRSEVPVKRVEFSGSWVATDSLTYTAEPALEITGPGFDSQGQYCFEVRGAPAVYLIETSSNLVNWATLSTVTISNAPVSLVDQDPPRQPARFYRARLAP